MTQLLIPSLSLNHLLNFALKLFENEKRPLAFIRHSLHEAVIDVNMTDTFCITLGKFKTYNKKTNLTGKYTLSDLVFC